MCLLARFVAWVFMALHVMIFSFEWVHGNFMWCVLSLFFGGRILSALVCDYHQKVKGEQ